MATTWAAWGSAAGRWALTCALALALGCGGGSDSTPPATYPTTTSRPPSTSPSTLPPASAPPPTTAPLGTPDDARRYLQEHGVDPDRLSEEVGEHMRRRFDPPSPR